MGENFSRGVGLDSYDKRIVEAVLQDGRISIVDLANRVGLSRTPCNLRLKRLIDDGVILGFHASLNYKTLGMSHIAFVELKLSDTREPALNEFKRAVRAVKEVEQCHLIAGPFDYLLKIRTQDIDSYRATLAESISTLPYVSSTSTFVVMESVKEPNHPSS